MIYRHPKIKFIRNGTCRTVKETFHEIDRLLFFAFNRSLDVHMFIETLHPYLWTDLYREVTGYTLFDRLLRILHKRSQVKILVWNTTEATQPCQNFRKLKQKFWPKFRGWISNTRNYVGNIDRFLIAGDPRKTDEWAMLMEPASWEYQNTSALTMSSQLNESVFTYNNPTYKKNTEEYLKAFEILIT